MRPKSASSASGGSWVKTARTSQKTTRKNPAKQNAIAAATSRMRKTTVEVIKAIIETKQKASRHSCLLNQTRRFTAQPRSKVLPQFAEFGLITDGAALHHLAEGHG